MKRCYPIILTKCDDENGYLVTIPDFNNNTFGETISEAIDMARDAICTLGLAYEDAGDILPEPTHINEIKCTDADIKTLVDADFDAYRRMLDNRSVKKNCTIPSWLNEKAEAANVNFSAVLQEALKSKLQLEQ